MTRLVYLLSVCYMYATVMGMLFSVIELSVFHLESLYKPDSYFHFCFLIKAANLYQL
jgi:hypothetical protein